MAYGAQFINDSGVLQLGAGVSNYFLVQKGSVYSSSGLQITVTPSVPYNCIAVRVVEINRAVVPKGIDVALKPAGTSQIFQKADTSALTLEWYAFRSYATASPAVGQYGLELYNADGTLGFSTAYPYLMKGFKVPMFFEQGPVDFTADASRNWAVLYYGTVPRGQVVNVSGEWRSYHRGRYTGRSSTPGVHYSAITLMAGVQEGYIIYDINQTGRWDHNGFMMIDVTNY